MSSVFDTDHPHVPARLGGEGVRLGANILRFRGPFEGAAWATQDSIERLSEGEAA